MKKKTTGSYSLKEPAIVAEEPMLGYIATVPLFLKKTTIPTIKIFTYKHFKKVVDKIDFSLQDWADLLCISERTLQRYAKSNAAFNGLQVERILLLEKLIIEGNEIFGKNLAKWLKEPSIKYIGATPYSNLFTYDGIINVTRYIGQLEWGIFA